MLKKILSIFLSLCISVSVLCGMDFKTYAVEGTDYLSQSDVDFITGKYLYVLDETTKAMHIKNLTDIDHQNSDTYWQSVSYVINNIQSDLNKISPYMPKALSESQLYKIGNESIKYISAGVEILKNVDYIVNEDTNTYQQCYHGLQIIGNICSVTGINLGPLGPVLSILSTTFIIADILNQAYVKEQLGFYESELLIAYYTNQELPIPQDFNSSIKNEYYDGACALYLKYSLMQFRDNNKYNNDDPGDVPPTEIPVSSVVFNTNKYTLFYNSIVTNPATVYPSNATDKSITYYSGNTSIATVDQSGEITPVNPGTVTIYAEASNGVTGSCDIKIFPFEASEKNNSYTITKYIGSGSAVTIPDYVNSKPIVTIGNSAFKNSTNLTSITIPPTIKSIGVFPFSGCSSLETVNISDLAAWCGISFDSQWSNPLDCAQYLYINGKLATNITIPSGAEKISRYAFYDYDLLESINIPNSVKSIGDYAFDDCDSLKKITIGNGVSSIGTRAFYGCDSLKSIVIGNNVSNIGVIAFGGCNSLEEIKVNSNNSIYHSKDNCLIETKTKTLVLGCKNSIIPTDNSVTSIEEYAFYKYDFITNNINIPDNITNIGYASFRNSTNLTSLSLRSNIGSTSFGDCKDLKNVTVFEGPTSIGNNAFEFCSNLENIIIPNTVTSIGSDAFRYCTNLKNIVIPNKIVTIEYSTFSNCTSLTSVIIPDSVTTISTWAFRECTSLRDITIPDSVTTIASNAFMNCTNLTAYCNTQTVANLLESANCEYRRFGDFDNDKKLSSTDVVVMRKSLLGVYDESYTKKIADINQDNDFNILDLVRLKKQVAA